MSGQRRTSTLFEFAAYRKIPYAVIGSAFAGSATFWIGSLAINSPGLLQGIDSVTAPEAIRALLFLILTGTLVGGLLSGVFVLLIGLPAHTLLIRYTRAAAWIYAVAGFGLGAACGGLIVLGFAPPPRGVLGIVEGVGLCAAGGAMAALAFWLIRRPDRDVF